MKNHNPTHVLFFLIIVLSCIQLAKAQPNDAVTPVNVGVVLDMETWVGKVSTSCMYMAISDFYAIHDDYKTRLVLHTRDSKLDVIHAAFAAVDLLESSKVQVIIGPQKSDHTEFIVELGDRIHLPIISFSATIPSIYSRSPYFIRTTPDDHTQVKAIASITQAFDWRNIILIHEDTDYGNRLVPNLIDAFQDINTNIHYRSAIPPLATNDQIVMELHKLMIMPTSVLIVHMSASFGTKFFLNAEKEGMMAKGYVWIITNGLMNVLESLEPIIIASMQGVLGVNPHIATSRNLESFTTRWKRKFIEENPHIQTPEMVNFGLWAYDTIWALALAAERVGDMKPNFFKLNMDGNSTELLGMGVSETGPKLLNEILKSKFTGLSGEFHLVNGQLPPSAFQILNVIGKGGKEVGFWTSKHGISRGLNLPSERAYSASADDFQDIIWPGGSTTVPKGWLIPKNGKKLRIGVPVKGGFSELVEIIRDPHTNAMTVGGYCIDVFKSAIATLPYTIPYEFVPIQTEDGDARSYNDLIDQVYLQNYDALVGDITITANRSLYVDFGFPYTDGGVYMIVPIKRPKETEKKWLLLTEDVGILSFSIAFFIFTGFTIWVLEQVDHVGGTSQPNSMTLKIIRTVTLGKKGTSFLSMLMVFIGIFIIVGLMSTYVANLTSTMTRTQLKPTITDFNDLIKHQDFVGYRKGSFIAGLLKRFHFDESRLKTYSTPEECHELLSKGSQNGGVAAVFDEIPYINIFLAKYCSKYTMVGPTHRTDGFGFVFPIGSPLVSDISKAVLKVTEGNNPMDMAWFKPDLTCKEDQSTIFTPKLFSLLHIIVCVIVLSLLIKSSRSFRKDKQIEQNQTSVQVSTNQQSTIQENSPTQHKKTI
ncbi:hypothetical protein IFM89_004311 [Coptis chinensis]|uniref:Glutamate receptor n=1 Tax=Coptis chinensis TaxID=261450 RepID=A0A835LZ43_9MAGN|nr:hypothetical protein IFM89_004311 [Coptis chinensis]